MLQHLPVVLIVASLAAKAETHLAVYKVVEFLSANGHTSIIIAPHQNNFGTDLFTLKLHRELLKCGKFYTNVVSMSEYEDVIQRGFHVLSPKLLNNNLSKVMNIVSKTRVKMSLLVLEEKTLDIKKLSKIFAESKKNMFFYVVAIVEKELHWFQVITLRTGFSINKIQFLEHMVIDDSYFNLNGIRVRSLDLDWVPYVWVSNCKNDYNEWCSVKGFNVDMVDLIAEQLNFTYASTMEPNNDWGFEKVDAATDPTVEMNFTGVMGGVIRGQYDLSLSTWIYLEKRSRVLSFSTNYREEKVLVLIPKVPNIDFGIFTRPLTTSAWGGIVGVILLTLLTSSFINYNGLEDAFDSRIWATSIWLFFVLLNSFYGGAMTMFFANDITLPFENTRDVIRAYPEWTLLMRKDTEPNYTPYVDNQDPDYVAFMDRVNSNPEAMTYDTMEEGIRRLTNGHTVIHVAKEWLNSVISKNPKVVASQRLFIFGNQKKASPGGIIFTLNSPLRPLFDRAITRLRESGAYNFLERKW